MQVTPSRYLGMPILLIEDDKDIAELIAYNFGQEKMAITVCPSGAEGISKARKTVPDLIILDLMLPDFKTKWRMKEGMQ